MHRLSLFNLSQDVDKATSARIALEQQLENLESELAFLQRVQKEVCVSFHRFVHPQHAMHMNQRLVSGFTINGLMS